MCAASVIQHAMRMRHTVICSLHGSTLFSYSLLKGKIFKKKKSCWTQNMCFDFLNNVFLKHFSF